MHALLVDDDRELARLLSDYLASHGVSIDHVGEGALALERLDGSDAYDIVLLDVMLPGIDGFEVCRRIRAKYDVPVVMLTARGEDTDRVVGLEIGADDYVPKPFNPRELLARMRAVLRRVGEPTERRVESGPRTMRFSGWTLDLARRRLLNPDAVEVPLTGGEYDLLVALVERANRVLTRDMLLDLLRGRQAGPFDRAIDVAVSRLRRKLDDNGRQAQLIKTVRGGGYVLAAEVERA